MKNSLSRDCIFDIIYFSGPHIKLRVNRLFPGGKEKYDHSQEFLAWEVLFFLWK